MEKLNAKYPPLRLRLFWERERGGISPVSVAGRVIDAPRFFAEKGLQWPLFLGIIFYSRI